MAKDNLRHKAASGMIWTAFQKYSTMIVSFVSGIVLARLLTPADYGSIGMLAIFMALAENFIDGGFGSALIQKKNPTQADYSTVFFFNLTMSLFLYIVVYISAPTIATFYDIPILSDVLRVQGFVLFIYAFNVIQRNQIRKNLQFKKLARIQIITSLTSLIITIVMAYLGFGVWALVVQNILVALIPCVFFWITTRWHPSWMFSWGSFRELFGFGFYMFLTHTLNTFSKKISGLLIGRWYNPATLGFYSKATTTEHMASDAISGIMIQTTYPLYASVQDDNARLINMIKRLSATISYITTPLLVILILVAEPLFLLLYSDKWLPSVPYFQILCIAGLASCLQAVNNQPIAAIGKSKQMFWGVIVKRSISITLQLVGIILWGMKGLLIAFVFTSWFSYYVNIYLVSKYIGYKVMQQLKDLAPTFIVACIAFISSYLLGCIFNLNIYVDALLKIITFILIYGGWSWIFKPDAFTYSLSILQSFKTKKAKR